MKDILHYITARWPRWVAAIVSGIALRTEGIGVYFTMWAMYLLGGLYVVFTEEEK